MKNVLEKIRFIFKNTSLIKRSSEIVQVLSNQNVRFGRDW